MRRTVKRPPVLFALTLCTLALSAAAPASDSAFRGRNGLIVFASTMNFTVDQARRGIALELYSIDARGGHLTRLTKNGQNDEEPTWSPDARRIAFVRDCCGLQARRRHIYVMNADGTGAHNISGRHDDVAPAWSPDGRLIAFRTLAGEELWVMNANGSNRRQLRTAKGNPVRGDRPIWSPDGREIAFNGFNPDVLDNPEGGVLALNVETGAVRLLLRDGWFLEWSPDGKRIMFAGPQGGFLVARADGTHRNVLRTPGGSSAGCSWSPDGRKMVCTSAFPPHPYMELTVMNADGSGKTRLTNDYADEAQPDWGRARS